MSKKKYIKLILFALGLLFLILFVRRIGFSNILSGLALINWMIIPVSALWVFVYFMNALAWRETFDKSHVSLSFSWKYTVAGFAVNSITPFVSLGGEPLKAVSLGKKIGTVPAISSVLTFNLIHWLSHFLIWIIASLLILFSFKLSFQFSFYLVCGTLALIPVIFLFFFLINRGFLSSLRIKNVFKWFSLGAKQNPASISHIDNDLSEFVYASPAKFFFSLFADFGSRLLQAVEIYLILQCMGVEISLFYAFIIYAGSSLFTNLFFFIPMQLGTRESGMFLSFQLIGLNPELGVVVSLITRIREFFWVIIGMAFLTYENFVVRKNILSVNANSNN